MSPILFGSIAAGMLILVLVRRFARNSFLRRNNHLVNGVLLASCLFLIGYHFYIKGQRTGLIAVGLGSVAAGKYLFDQRDDNPEE